MCCKSIIVLKSTNLVVVIIRLLTEDNLKSRAYGRLVGT